jgi:hypothetical protein
MNDAWPQAMLADMKKELSFNPNVEFYLKNAHDNKTGQPTAMGCGCELL